MKGTLETWQMQVGDLCMFIGDEKHSQLHNRIVYQVVEKKEALASSFSHHEYRYRVAFDIQNPVGVHVDTVSAYGTRGMRKLGLVDVGTVRLHLDNFLREWARSMGVDGSDDAT